MQNIFNQSQINLFNKTITHTYIPQEEITSPSFYSFSINFIDNYVTNTLINVVGINRTLNINYYYIYLTCLYLSIIFVLLILFFYITKSTKYLLCFFIRFKTLSKYEQHSFKKRYSVKHKTNFKYTSGVYIYTEKKILFEGVYYTLLRKFLRKKIKKKGVSKI
jgi:predicted neutral ceramidase superfamily lipid hydrolase